MSPSFCITTCIMVMQNVASEQIPVNDPALLLISWTPPMWPKLVKTGVTMVMLATTLAGCATRHYTPLGDADKDEIEQLNENVYRAESNECLHLATAAGSLSPSPLC